MPKVVTINGQLTGAGSYAKIARDLMKAFGDTVILNDKHFETCLNLCPPPYYVHTAAVNIGLAAFEGNKAPRSWTNMAKRQDVLITFSEHNENAFGLKMRYLKPPVDTQQFRLGTGNNGERPQVLFVGQIDERKGLTVLLEATKHLPGVDFLLHLVKVEHGDDAPIVTHVRIKDAPENVHFTERLLSDDEIVELYQQSDVYVLPTRGEGWQQTTLEALSCGCNVIVTDEPSAHCLKRRSGVFFVKGTVCEPDKGWCDRNANSHYAFDWYYVDPNDLVKSIQHAIDHPVSREKCHKTAMDFDIKNLANEMWRLCT